MDGLLYTCVYNCVIMYKDVHFPNLLTEFINEHLCNTQAADIKMWLGNTNGELLSILSISRSIGSSG